MRSKILVACCIWAVAGTASSSASKRAFEIADYYRTAFVGAPEVSRDGSLAAFAVTRYELEAGESWSEIWVVGADGSGLRQMTFGRHHDGSPTFSPDGSRLLFVSDRSGESQLWVMAVDGGEARQLTHFPLGVSDPLWSPDGRFIAVSSRVYPECGYDPECNATILAALEGGPLRARMTDELLYRHWTTWREGRFAHVLLVDAESGEVARDMTPGRWDSPTFAVGGGGGYAFSPDGSELCVVSNRDADQARSTNSDLWLISVDPEATLPEARNITAANRGWDGSPVYSPSGRFIAYRSQATPGYESDLYRIALYDRNTGSTSLLTEREVFDNWIEELRWSSDERWLYFSGHEAGLTPVWRLDLEAGGVDRVFADGSLVGWELGADAESVLYVRSRVGEPPELFSRMMTDGGSVPLTSFNADLAAEVDIRPAEVMWVPGEDGNRIQVYVVKPHDFDPEKKYPLILNVHGGPQSPWKDRYRGDWQVYPGRGYAVAFPNPTGSAGFGQDFVDAIACDWGGRVFRDLMRVTDALEALPWIDGGRMGAMGWSYGGYMMMWFAGHTDRFAALASMMGVYDLRSMWGATEELWFVEHDLCGRPWDSEHYERWSPSASAGSLSTPTLVVTGEQDYRVPFTQSLHFFTDLQVREVPSRLVVFPDAGHWPGWYEMAFYYLVHLDWFHRWLGGQPAPWDPEVFLRNQVFVDTIDGGGE